MQSCNLKIVLLVPFSFQFECPWSILRLSSGKESACQCRRCKRCGFDPWFGKIPWRRKWHPTLVFLPGESHGQRSLVGCSPWGHKEWDTTACGHARMLLSPNIGRTVALFCLGLGGKDRSGTMLAWGWDRCLYHVTGVSTCFIKTSLKRFFLFHF